MNVTIADSPSETLVANFRNYVMGYEYPTGEEGEKS